MYTYCLLIYSHRLKCLRLNDILFLVRREAEMIFLTDMSECLSYLFRYQNNHGNKWLCLMTALQQVNNAEVALLSYKQVIYTYIYIYIYIYMYIYRYILLSLHYALITHIQIQLIASYTTMMECCLLFLKHDTSVYYETKAMTRFLY